jgi:excinuclease ABC subunit C
MSEIVSKLIEEQLKRLPQSPGVYLMRDAEGTILYIGKAINLYNRVRSYFSSGRNLTPKLERMVSRIADIDYFIATSEQEALILENNLIKQHHPRYNVRLKDDKTFPYLKIDLNNEWPRVFVTRSLVEDGGRYFGPFTNSSSVKQTLAVLQNIFPFRLCSKTITGKAPRPCLEYHLGRCIAPCTGAVGHDEYMQVIKEVILFLEGKQDKVVRELKIRMNDASRKTNYEKAALIRDQIDAIRQVIDGEKIAATIRGEQDVIAFVQENDQAYVQVFFIRSNKLIGRENFLLQGTRQEEPSQIISSFIKQYYSSNQNIPPRLLLQYPVEDKVVIADWLRTKRGAAVDIQVPRRGNRKQLVDIAVENAHRGLEQFKIKEMVTPRSLDDALDEIQKELGLRNSPQRIEAYDISNIQGSSAVGSMVVFEQGKPNRAHYRRFRIKTVSGANDYAMMKEVLQRRFKRAGNGDSAKSDSWAALPDLILLDGGKGQLNTAIAVLEEINVTLPLASLAKENEEIFLPHRKEPITLPRSSPGLQLLQRLRDEAHRFAISYFSKLHRKKTFTSVLDSIPGVGPKRKSALIRRFGSVQGVREATIGELAAAAGINIEQAKKIKEHL